MTKEERRAEKIRMLVQSGSLFHDAAIALSRDTELPHDTALQCVFVAHLSNEVQSLRHEVAGLSAALEAAGLLSAEVGK